MRNTEIEEEKLMKVKTEREKRREKKSCCPVKMKTKSMSSVAQ